MRRKTTEAVEFAKLDGSTEVNRAPRTFADVRRFGDGELAVILAHGQTTAGVIRFPAPGERSLQPSTHALELFGDEMNAFPVAPSTR